MSAMLADVGESAMSCARVRPPTCRRSRMLACRSGESTIGAEVLMNNVG